MSHLEGAGRIYDASVQAELAAKGRRFESETDTEVIAHLIDEALKDGQSPLSSFKTALDRLEGAYALAVLVEGGTRAQIKEVVDVRTHWIAEASPAP